MSTFLERQPPLRSTATQSAHNSLRTSAMQLAHNSPYYRTVANSHKVNPVRSSAWTQCEDAAWAGSSTVNLLPVSDGGLGPHKVFHVSAVAEGEGEKSVRWGSGGGKQTGVSPVRQPAQLTWTAAPGIGGASPGSRLLSTWGCFKSPCFNSPPKSLGCGHCRGLSDEYRTKLLETDMEHIK